MIVIWIIVIGVEDEGWGGRSKIAYEIALKTILDSLVWEWVLTDHGRVIKYWKQDDQESCSSSGPGR